MSDTFLLKGTFKSTHSAFELDASGDMDIIAELSESLALKKKTAMTIALDVDGSEVVNMADLSGAHVVMVRSTQAVTLVVTSAAGSGQLLPAGKLFILVSESVPLTALSISRQPGVTTTVRIFLGEKA